MALHTASAQAFPISGGRQSLFLIALNGGILGGILCGWPRIQLGTWLPVILLVAGNFWLTGSRVSDLFTFGGGTKSPARTLWYVWCAFIAIFLVRQFVQNLEFQRENIEVGPVFATVDVFWKNLALFVGLANLMVWNRRQTYSERMASLLIAISTYALVNIVWDAVKPYQPMEIFGESRIEGKEARWIPPLARSNAFFAYMCACTISTALGWGISRLLKRGIGWHDWLTGLLVAAFIPAAIWAAVKAEFRSNAAAVAVALGMAFVPILRRRPFGLYSLLAVLMIFPVLFFGPLGYDVLKVLSPEKLTSAAGARSEEDATLSYRTYLWEYAGRRLGAEPQVLLMGDGPVMRDASPGYFGVDHVGYRMNFHSAPIEFLMGNGLILTLVAFGCVIRMIFLLFKKGEPRTQPAGTIEGFDACVFFYASCFVISVVDPGIAYFEGFSLLMLPGFGLLLEQNRRKVRAMAPKASGAALARRAAGPRGPRRAHAGLVPGAASTMLPQDG